MFVNPYIVILWEVVGRNDLSYILNNEKTYCTWQCYILNWVCTPKKNIPYNYVYWNNKIYFHIHDEYTKDYTHTINRSVTTGLEKRCVGKVVYIALDVSR